MQTEEFDEQPISAAASSRATRQNDIYKFIVKHVHENGFAPSIREICQALGLRSTSTVHYHLTTLAKRGLIEWADGKNRAIRLLGSAAPKAAFHEPSRGLPVVGRIAAGRPIEAIAESEEFIDLETKFAGTDVYVLKVKGDSMIEDHIQDGDYVIIKRQETARNGDIVVALLEGGEATLKRFYRERNGGFRLQPANRAMAPLVVDKLDIQGKLIGLLRAQF